MDQPTEQQLNGTIAVGTKTPAASNHFHIKVDASKNSDEQKTEANNQIKAQLGNYDGKGAVSVLREISTRQIDRSDTEGKMAYSFQEVMTSRLQEHITREILKQTNAIRIATTDEIKIAHPEQRQANESKDALEKDNSKQNNTVTNTADSIKQDNKQIEQVTKKIKR